MPTSRSPRSADPNPVAELHNAVADRANPAEASTRPAGTLGIELAIMTRYVVRRLQLSGAMSVLEIGCGTGIFAEPIARTGARYVGVDFAQRPVEILRERTAAGPLAARIEAHNLDPLAEPVATEALGRFDRVLMYAVLHYVRSETEGRELIQLVVDRLRPGGRALIGNVPLADLQWELRAPTRSAPQRLWSMIVGERGPLPTQPIWRLSSALFVTAKRMLSRWSEGAAQAPSMAPGQVIALTRPMIESWLPDTVRHRWQRGAVGAPLPYGRADLLITRDG
jgi:SAM-dependent methyltransferase